MTTLIISVRTHNPPTTPQRVVSSQYIICLQLYCYYYKPSNTQNNLLQYDDLQLFIKIKKRKQSLRQHQILFIKEKSQLLSRQNKTSTQAFVQIWTVCWWLHNNNIKTLRLIRAWSHNIWDIGYKCLNLKN